MFVAGFDVRGCFGVERSEKFEKLGGLEGFEIVACAWTVGRTGGVDDDERESGVDGAELFDELSAGCVFNAGIDNDTVDEREALEGFYGFLAAVSGDDIELGSLNDELAGGDAAGVFAVNNEETGPGHTVNYEP